MPQSENPGVTLTPSVFLDNNPGYYETVIMILVNTSVQYIFETVYI